jgi:hypothetical protein
MKHLSILFLIVLASCKPSDKYSVDNLYPIPANPTIISSDLASTEQIEEPQLQPYVDAFYNLKSDAGIGADGHRVFYKLKDLSSYGSILGRCETYNNANIVYVDNTFFASATAWDIKSVVYHEFGHCDLGRAHRTVYWQGTMANYSGIKPNWGSYTRYLSDGVTANPNYRGEWPLSLMHRSVVRQAKFQVEYDYYVYELFHEGLSEVPTLGNSSQNCEARFELDGNIHFE